MIIEYIRYNISENDRAAFEQAYKDAGKVMLASSHCLGYEITHGSEEPEHYVVRIKWDSLDGHMQGFRQEPGFQEFFGLVKPFYTSIEEMKHYEIVATEDK